MLVMTLRKKVQCRKNMMPTDRHKSSVSKWKRKEKLWLKMRTGHFCLNLQMKQRLNLRLVNVYCIWYNTVKMMIIRLFGVFFVVFFTKSVLFIRSGKFLFGLVKKICLPDRMSGKNLNTFANTGSALLFWPSWNTAFVFYYDAHLLYYWNCPIPHIFFLTLDGLWSKYSCLWNGYIWGTHCLFVSQSDCFQYLCNNNHPCIWFAGVTESPSISVRPSFHILQRA